MNDCDFHRIPFSEAHAGNDRGRRTIARSFAGRVESPPSICSSCNVPVYDPLVYDFPVCDVLARRVAAKPKIAAHAMMIGCRENQQCRMVASKGQKSLSLYRRFFKTT
jgi:hypothetical protein